MYIMKRGIKEKPPFMNFSFSFNFNEYVSLSYDIFICTTLVRLDVSICFCVDVFVFSPTCVYT